jgi:hypothetical protein
VSHPTSKAEADLCASHCLKRPKEFSRDPGPFAWVALHQRHVTNIREAAMFPSAQGFYGATPDTHVRRYSRLSTNTSTGTNANGSATTSADANANANANTNPNPNPNPNADAPAEESHDVAGVSTSLPILPLSSLARCGGARLWTSDAKLVAA